MVKYKIEEYGTKSLIILFLCLLMIPQTIFGGESGRITIYEKDSNTGNGVIGIKLTAYQISKGNRLEGKGVPDDSFQKAFDDGLVSLDSNKLSSSKTIEDLEKYVKQENIVSEYPEQITDGEGRADFTGLSDGVYLIVQSNVPADFKRLGYTAETESYIIEIPSIDGDGNRIRSVVCNPKCTVTYPPSETISIDVYKEWKDSSNKYGARPDSITVGLFKSGGKKPVSIEVLSAKNNWHFKWNALDKSADWHVDEISRNPNYEKSVIKEGKGDLVFTIVNKYKPPSAKPSTGDDSGILFFISAFLGAAILIAAMLYKEKSSYRKR